MPKGKKTPKKTLPKGSGDSGVGQQPSPPNVTGAAAAFKIEMAALEGRVDAKLGRIETAVEQLADFVTNPGSKGSKGNRKSRRRQPSPSRCRDSSSDSSSSRSSSSDSRSRSRSRSRSPKRARGKHPFAQRNFLGRHEKVDSFDRLMLVNIRTINIAFEQGQDIRGLVDHVEMLCQKSSTKVFQVAALCNYDKAVRLRADREGIAAFSKVEAGDILKYFSYDSSMNAVSSRTSKSKPKSDNSGKPCFSFNKADLTCTVVGCKYKHVCMYCHSTAHGASECNAQSKKSTSK